MSGFNPVGKSFSEIEAALAANPAIPSDLGSTPPIAWSRGFLPNGPESKPFRIHDEGYRRRGVGLGHCYTASGALQALDYTRKQVDDILLEAMMVVGCDPLKSELIYEAVRLGGAKDWGS